MLSELKAKIRREIFDSLQIGKELGVTDINDKNNETPSEDNKRTKTKQLEWNKQEIVINELIKEYMAFHGLDHSVSVFSAETNSKHKKVNLESQLMIEREENDDIPLIYDIVDIKQ